MIAMRRVCWELNDDDHDHLCMLFLAFMMHCGYCHHGGDLGSDVAELHGLGSESTPTTGVGHAALCGGDDGCDSIKIVFHFLIEFTIGTDANASPFL